MWCDKYAESQLDIDEQPHAASYSSLSDKLVEDIHSCNYIVVRGTKLGQIHEYTADRKQFDLLITVAKAFVYGCFTNDSHDQSYSDIILTVRNGRRESGWELDKDVQVRFYCDKELVFDISFFFDVNWDASAQEGQCRYKLLVDDDIDIVSKLHHYQSDSEMDVSGYLVNEWNLFFKDILLK